MKRNSLLSKFGAFALSLMLVGAAAAGGLDAQAAQILAARHAITVIEADLAGVDAPSAVVSAEEAIDTQQINALGNAGGAFAEKGQEASSSSSVPTALGKRAAIDLAFATTARAADLLAGAAAPAAGVWDALNAGLAAKATEVAI